MAYDLLIKDGRIIDGSGGPSFSGDVAIKDGKIVDMGKLNGTATQTVHADGQVVAPGFIDIHTHMDAQLTWDPLATSSCWHGITTVVTGNCSFAIAPCKPEDREHVLRTLVRVEGMSLNALQAGIVGIGHHSRVFDGTGSPTRVERRRVYGTQRHPTVCDGSTGQRTRRPT